MAAADQAPPAGAAQQRALYTGVLELETQATPTGNVNVSGGFLRSPERHLQVRSDDPYLPGEVIRKYRLRGGESISGPVVKGDGRTRGRPTLARIEQVMEVPVAQWLSPPPLNETVAIDPLEALHFSTPGGPKSMFVVDLLTPIGRGQRGLIVAPPRTGKTVLLQQMAHGIAENYPEVFMIVLLIDERPEEVTEMRRNVRGAVIASSNDEHIESHVRVARLVVDWARRMVECGRHIVILLDSITRLARAFNAFVGSSGRTMTGGLDIRALQEPKQIFGSARNVEAGGSLTIIGTALVDTGSRADDFIFQEFKGTGNMELVLNRELANLRIWPAMDVQQSGTRKEEKLLDEQTLKKAILLRRQLIDLPLTKAIPELLKRMDPHKTLTDFLASLRA